LSPARDAISAMVTNIKDGLEELSSIENGFGGMDANTHVSGYIGKVGYEKILKKFKLDGVNF